MPASKTQEAARTDARVFERELTKEKRKRLGQYFTGLPLGKLLAYLAFSEETRSVLDPMAGHGDLLDAAAEVAIERGIDLENLDGIEIDADTAVACRNRLDGILGKNRTKPHKIISGDAFDLVTLNHLSRASYDLVITNPPYVRYQTMKDVAGQGEAARQGLIEIIDKSEPDANKSIWRTLASGYSGLADLSVPSWLLAAFLVRPGGRLALVVPATWRTRDYGDVIRYMLLRFFKLETIVEDTQPGWFSGALVRTHLVVARRLPNHESAITLESRAVWSSAHWLQISPEAATTQSLVGSVFDQKVPESELVRWLAGIDPPPRSGLQLRTFSLQEEWIALRSRVFQSNWFKELEHSDAKSEPHSRSSPSRPPVVLPESFRDILGNDYSVESLVKLEQAHIHVGQGLRTGCNRFFYMEICGSQDGDMVPVQASEALGGRKFSVPMSSIRPVLWRQAEISLVTRGETPPGRVLDLRQWILPEDAAVSAAAQDTYSTLGEVPPNIMPDELAAFVRFAATAVIEEGKRIPDLSAVRTNVRPHRPGKDTPRFWYMLPAFTSRHMPAAFVARINHGIPWVESNLDEPVLIDANFSTFWTIDHVWTPAGLKALFNSTWCRFFMETLGTPFGGGALKLEATHIREMLIPNIPKEARERLAVEGGKLARNKHEVLSIIDDLLLDALGLEEEGMNRLITAMKSGAEARQSKRQRIAV